MAFPIIYVQTNSPPGSAAATNSGSSDIDTSAALTGAAGAGTISSAVLDLSLDAPDLSGVATDGTATIYMNGATNPRQKIFRITAKDNTAKTVTVDTNMANTFSSSQWTIGGRFLWTPTVIEDAIKPGWTVIFNNSPDSSASRQWQARFAGNITDGPITFKGKDGTQPTLQSTGVGTHCIDLGSFSFFRIENLILDQDHASSGFGIAGTGGGLVVKNVKVVDAPQSGFSMTTCEGAVVGCDISGTVDGINVSGISTFIGNYIHDISGSGILDTGPTNSGSSYLFNIFDTCAGAGISLSNTSNTVPTYYPILNNTFYNCGTNGILTADDHTSLAMLNNIFSENGNAAGEANVEFLGTSSDYLSNSYHSNNIFFNTASGGGEDNVVGLTVNSTESTADPQLADPANADFRIASTSPAKGAGYPGVFLGGPTGYLDIGAVQRQESGGGARIIGG